MRFMDLKDVYNYNPTSRPTSRCTTRRSRREHVSTLSQRVLDNMLGASYDTFPWFRAVAIGGLLHRRRTREPGRQPVAGSASRSARTGRVRAGLQRRKALAEQQADNPAQLFVHDGEQFSYAFLPDQGWHLAWRAAPGR